ncbi:MAG: ogr/Delta-like zinc finger family protein [Acidobacteria bacterium]|nr:ogr/Delta-like zinc finger family protein [Acidobacteriota bacterium]
MERDFQTRCPHCEGQMARWENPPQSTWSGGFQYVCFNDDCPYFVRGWVWMKETVNVDASYRFRLDPETGETGALAVWSKEALKSGILPEERPARAD